MNELKKSFSRIKEGNKARHKDCLNLFLNYEGLDLDLFSNRMYNPLYFQKNWLKSLSVEEIKALYQSELFNSLSSSEQKELKSDAQFTSDKGIIEIIDSFNELGFITLESCSGLHLEELKPLSWEEKLLAVSGSSNRAEDSLFIWPHIVFMPDQKKIKFNKMLKEIEKTSELFTLNFDQGEATLSLNENSIAWVNILKAIYFWRSLKTIIGKIS